MENKFEKLFKSDTGIYKYGNYEKHDINKDEIEYSQRNKSFFEVLSYLKDDKEKDMNKNIEIEY
mgnify:CR=1 FL=1